MNKPSAAFFGFVSILTLMISGLAAADGYSYRQDIQFSGSERGHQCTTAFQIVETSTQVSSKGLSCSGTRDVNGSCVEKVRKVVYSTGYVGGNDNARGVDALFRQFCDKYVEITGKLIDSSRYTSYPCRKP